MKPSEMDKLLAEITKDADILSGLTSPRLDSAVAPFGRDYSKKPTAAMLTAKAAAASARGSAKTAHLHAMAYESMSELWGTSGKLKSGKTPQPLKTYKLKDFK